MATSIRIEDERVLTALRDLASQVNDLSPLMQEIAAFLKSGVEESFRLERAPDGTAWRPLAEATVRQRRKSRQESTGRITILNRRGGRGLVGSIVTDSGPRHAAVGAGKEYGIFHQFGTRFIPARPFLGLSDKTRRQILNRVEQYFTP